MGRMRRVWLSDAERAALRFAMLTRKARINTQLRIAYDIVLDSPANRSAIEHWLIEDALLTDVLIKLGE